MNATISPTRRALPDAHQARLQGLLDQADLAWFARNPGATQRVRFHFRNERVEPGRSAQRHVIVTIEGDRLVRRFTSEGAAA